VIAGGTDFLVRMKKGEDPHGPHRWNPYPPFGLNCYVMKSVVQGSLSLSDIFRGTTPFALLHAVGMVFVMIWPQIAVWLPGLLK
jgi:hypothetical protein